MLSEHVPSWWAVAYYPMRTYMHIEPLQVLFLIVRFWVITCLMVPDEDHEMCMSDILLAHYTIHIQKVNLKCQSDSLSSREWCYDCFRSRPSTQAGAFKIDCWLFCPTLFLFLAPPQRNKMKKPLCRTQLSALVFLGQVNIQFVFVFGHFGQHWVELLLLVQKCSCCQVQNYVPGSIIPDSMPGSIMPGSKLYGAHKSEPDHPGHGTKSHQEEGRWGRSSLEVLPGKLYNFGLLSKSLSCWHYLPKGGRDWKCHWLWGRWRGGRAWLGQCPSWIRLLLILLGLHDNSGRLFHELWSF